MIGFVIAALILAYIAAFLFFAHMLVETDNKLWLGAAALWLVFGFGLIINAAISEGNRGPCLRYETTMQYNPATKTMMPARYCANRAEWVQP